MADTATAELDTAPPPAETTEALEESPESELPEGTETDNGSEVETDSVEATDGEENGEPPEPEVISKEEHEKALKAERAKLEESFRQKTENAQKQAEDAANKAAFTQRVTEAAKARHRSTYEGLAAAIKDVMTRRENGEDVDIDADKLMVVAARQGDAAYWEQDANYGVAFQAWALRNGYRPTVEQAAKVQRALHLSPSDPTRIPQHFEAQMELWEAAQREILMPKLREEIEAKVREELGAAKKTAAMKEADAARAAQPKPTGVGTSGAGARALSFKTQQQVDMALYKGEIDSSTARKWLAKGLPYS